MAKFLFVCVFSIALLQVCVALSPKEALEYMRNRMIQRQEGEKDPTADTPTESIHLPTFPPHMTHITPEETHPEETTKHMEETTKQAGPVTPKPPITFTLPTTTTEGVPKPHVSGPPMTTLTVIVDQSTHPADCNQCTKVYDPVCASNRQSYYNPCKLFCGNSAHNLTIMYYGKCIPF